MYVFSHYYLTPRLLYLLLKGVGLCNLLVALLLQLGHLLC